MMTTNLQGNQLLRFLLEMIPISQLRWNIRMDAQEEYDCSMGGNSTIDWSTRGVVRPYFGIYSLLFALITIPLYILSAQVIWRMRKSSTYKVMFVLAIADISTLFVNSFTFGIFLLKGEMYCHHPKMHFVNALVIMFSFTLSCISCLLLAINRMIELVSGRMYYALFKGSRTWFILFISFFYPFFLASFTPLFFFNSEYHLVTVTPGFNEDRYEYYNLAHILNNTLMPSLSCVVYGFMIVYILIKKSRSGIQDNSSVNRAAMMLSLQSGIIVCIHFTTCLSYEITQFIPPSDGILYFAQITWQLEHGLPPFIYLAFNQSLRNGMKQHVVPVRSSVMHLQSSVSPAMRTHISAPSQFEQTCIEKAQYLSSLDNMRAIAQLRWNILMDSQEEYDCRNSTIDWSTRGIGRPYFAAICVLFAIVTIPLYILSAVVIWSLRRSSTYKVMFVLALADILTLFVNSLTFGFFLAMVTDYDYIAENSLLKGEMYCHHPKMHFINAFVIQFGFTLSCITCLLLAINRMLELISGRLFKLIFKGSRTWYLLIVSLIYPFFLASFTPLFFSNSEYHIATVNPGIFEDKFEYYNVAHMFNNFLMSSLSALVYVVMLLFVLFRKMTSSIQNHSSVNRAAMMLSLQSGIIVCIHFTTGITYEITQYIPPSDGILYIAQFAWMLEHGLPPLIYIFFNQTVREGVRQYVAHIGSSIIHLPSSIKPKALSAHQTNIPMDPLSQSRSRCNL